MNGSRSATLAAIAALFALSQHECGGGSTAGAAASASSSAAGTGGAGGATTTGMSSSGPSGGCTTGLSVDAACLDCVQSSCCKEATDCRATPQCTEIFDCLHACKPFDSACRLACTNSCANCLGLGASLYLDACIAMSCPACAQGT